MAFYVVKTHKGVIVAKCSSLKQAIKKAKAETQHNFKKNKVMIYNLDSCEKLTLDEAISRLEKNNFEKKFLQGGAPGSGKRR